MDSHLREEILEDLRRDKGLENIAIHIKYKNWKKKIGLRRVVGFETFYGSNEYHRDEQWLWNVWDLDKNDWRTYALNGIIEWVKVP